MKKINILIGLGILGVSLLVLVLGFQRSPSTLGDVVNNQQVPLGRFQQYRFFATSTSPIITTIGQSLGVATTTSATSTSIIPWTDANGRIDNGYFVIAGARAVNLYFSRDAGAGANQGSTQFRIQVTNEATTTSAINGLTDWYDYNVLEQNIATSTTPTTIPTVTISAATSTVVVGMNMNNQAFYAIRCIALRTTDGSSGCQATATW